MNKRSKYMKMMAVGLVLISVANILKFCTSLHVNDFLVGISAGTGVGIILASFWKMRTRPVR